ncbi:MAG: energy transducer TonB [Sphingobacteriales bacterium]
MRLILITVALFAISSVAKAQKNDTTIYDGCKQKDDTTTVIGAPSILDSCPQFKNGYGDFNKYIDTHIRYRDMNKPSDSQKRLYIEMIIEKDGSITHAKVVRSVSNEFDKEVLRVVNSSPKWEPGTLHGQKVRVRYWVVVSYNAQ